MESLGQAFKLLAFFTNGYVFGQLQVHLCFENL